MNQGPDGLPVIVQPIAIKGDGAKIVRAANAAPFRIFNVGVGGELTLHGVTVKGGDDRGGVGGGGLLVQSGGKAVIDGSAVVENRSATSGGGIANFGVTKILSGHEKDPKKPAATRRTRPTTKDPKDPATTKDPKGRTKDPKKSADPKEVGRPEGPEGPTTAGPEEVDKDPKDAEGPEGRRRPEGFGTVRPPRRTARLRTARSSRPVGPWARTAGTRTRVTGATTSASTAARSATTAPRAPAAGSTTTGISPWTEPR